MTIVGQVDHRLTAFHLHGFSSSMLQPIFKQQKMNEVKADTHHDENKQRLKK